MARLIISSRPQIQVEVSPEVGVAVKFHRALCARVVQETPPLHFLATPLHLYSTLPSLMQTGDCFNMADLFSHSLIG